MIIFGKILNYMSIFSSNNKDTQPAPAPTPRPASTATPSASPAPSMSRGVSATMIAQGTQIDGNVKIEGNIQIEGIIKGTLTSKGKVIIGSSGVVEGDVLCQHAEISGKVNGKLKIADILFLKSSARIDGDIHTGKLVMESGVQFNGNCSMGSAATVPSASEKKATSNPAPISNAPSSATMTQKTTSGGATSSSSSSNG